MKIRMILAIGLALPACAQSTDSEWWFRILDAHTRVVEIKLTPPGAREQARRLKAQGKTLRPTVSVEELRREHSRKGGRALARAGLQPRPTGGR